MRVAVWFDMAEPAGGESTMPMSSPIKRRSHSIPCGDLQGDAIAAPEGEEPMPVTVCRVHAARAVQVGAKK
jgi:hypothetical protein